MNQNTDSSDATAVATAAIAQAVNDVAQVADALTLKMPLDAYGLTPVPRGPDLPVLPCTVTYTGSSVGPEPGAIPTERQFDLSYLTQAIAVTPSGKYLAYNGLYSESSCLNIFDAVTGKAVAYADRPYYGTTVEMADDAAFGNWGYSWMSAERRPGVFYAGKLEMRIGMSAGAIRTTADGQDPSYPNGQWLGTDAGWPARIMGDTRDPLTQPSNRILTGIASRNDFVYVSDATPVEGGQDLDLSKGPQQIWVFAKTGLQDPSQLPVMGLMQLVRKIPFAAPYRLVGTRDNQWVWLIQEVDAAAGRLARRIVKLGVGDTNAGEIALSIEEPGWNPTDVAIDPANRLLVSDAGPDRQIKIYDPLTGERVGTFGIKQGVLAKERRGDWSGGTFVSPESLDCDDNGVLYVLDNVPYPHYSAHIFKHLPDGNGTWKNERAMAIHGQHVGQLFTFDPGDLAGTVMGDLAGKSRLDQPTDGPPGWEPTRIMVAPGGFAPDCLGNQFPGVSGVRRLGGKRFLICGDWDKFGILRPDANAAYLSQPCLLFLNGKLYQDTNGDGKLTGDEIVADLPWRPLQWGYAKDGVSDGSFEHLYDISQTDGSFWRQAGYEEPLPGAELGCYRVERFRFLGLDEHQNPLWDWANPIRYRIPHPREYGEGVFFFYKPMVSASGEAALYTYSVSVAGRPRGFFLSRYALPKADGIGTLTWRVPMGAYVIFGRDQYTNWPEGGIYAGREGYMNHRVGFDIAGDYVFCVRNAGLAVDVLERTTGKPIGRLVTPYAPTIWVDDPRHVQASYRAARNGVPAYYIITVTDNYHNRTTVYYWRPGK